jgi:hypothetical protein
MRRLGIPHFSIFLLLSLMLAAPLVVDGQFSDWNGQPYISDSTGDGATNNSDITGFYWGTNPNEEFIYWMVERRQLSSGNPSVYYFIAVDTNNDGDYNSPADRLVRVYYDPNRGSSLVQVHVFNGAGTLISQASGDWGDPSDQGGQRVELRVSFADLGIDARQAISMYVYSSQNQNANNADRLPDTGDITWTPIHILDWAGLGLLLTVVIFVIWYRKGRWMWQTPSSMG